MSGFLLMVPWDGRPAPPAEVDALVRPLSAYGTSAPRVRHAGGAIAAFVGLEAERGAKAEALMRDPLWAETFDALAAGYAEAWAATAPSDAARREEIYRLQHALRAVKKHIEQVAAGGRIAVRELDELKARRFRVF